MKEIYLDPHGDLYFSKGEIYEDRTLVDLEEVKQGIPCESSSMCQFGGRHSELSWDAETQEFVITVVTVDYDDQPEGWTTLPPETEEVFRGAELEIWEK